MKNGESRITIWLSWRLLILQKGKKRKEIQILYCPKNEVVRRGASLCITMPGGDAAAAAAAAIAVTIAIAVAQNP